MEVLYNYKSNNYSINNINSDDFHFILVALELEIDRIQEIIEELGNGKEDIYLNRLNNVKKLKDKLNNFTV